jgi:hypothetical protein
LGQFFDEHLGALYGEELVFARTAVFSRVAEQPPKNAGAFILVIDRAIFIERALGVIGGQDVRCGSGAGEEVGLRRGEKLAVAGVLHEEDGDKFRGWHGVEVEGRLSLAGL